MARSVEEDFLSDEYQMNVYQSAVPHDVLKATQSLVLTLHRALQDLGEERNKRIAAEGDAAQLRARLIELQSAKKKR